MPAWAGIIALVLLGISFAAPATAQDTLPQSPPELKDFRLDTPPPREEVPTPQPKVEPPPAQTQSQPQPQPQPAPVRVQPIPERSAPERAVPVPKNGSDAAISADPSETILGTNTESPVPVVPAPEVAAASAAPDSGSVSDWLSWWPYLAALLAALAAFGLLRIAQRRKGRVSAKAAQPVPSAPIPVRKLPPQKPAMAPLETLTARFETGDARLSIANLTITGQLHLRFDGTKPLSNIKMRAQLISACDGQAAQIEAFHRDAHIRTGDQQDLGPIAPGESIDLKLQLQLPRDALQAFDWRERRFVAPIILVNIASENDEAPPCRLACVVGQVGDPGSPRLLPIPIDRGPKRFDSVQFQPIAA